MGLKERIQYATTSKEVDSLLEKGKAFTWAAEGVKRRWQRVAKEALRGINIKKNESRKKNESKKSS
jgi:hypothetical protein